MCLHAETRQKGVSINAVDILVQRAPERAQALQLWQQPSAAVTLLRQPELLHLPPHRTMPRLRPVLLLKPMHQVSGAELFWSV